MVGGTLVRRGFVEFVGLVAGFVLCGSIGGAVVLNAVPELRDKCSSGYVCGTLRLIGIVSAPAQATKPEASLPPPSTSAGCLSGPDREVLYRMSLALVGSPPPPPGSGLPTSLGLPSTGCVPVEDVASKICASLAREWTLSGDPPCDFQQKQDNDKR